jgi:hypothetical protein
MFMGNVCCSKQPGSNIFLNTLYRIEERNNILFVTYLFNRIGDE